LVRQHETNQELWFINLTQLETDFEQSINQYEAAINDSARPEQFPTGKNIFENYGWMNIG